MSKITSFFFSHYKPYIEIGKLAIIATLSLVSLFVSIFFLIIYPNVNFLFVYIFIPHLYLVPIILLALWFPKSGLRLVMVILLLLAVFWLFTSFLGYPFPPLFIILYTGLDLAIFVVFLLYVKDRRLVEAVISDLIIRSKDKTEENSEHYISSQRDFDDIISALNHHDEEVREEAIGVLSEIGDERVILPLISALRDPSPMVRRAAVSALGKTKSQKAVLPIIHTLSDKERVVREEAAETLGHLGEVANNDLLTFGNHIDWRVRAGVLVALRTSKCITISSIELIIGLMIDKNTYVRREAVKTLGRVGDHQILPYLIQALHDPDSGVRIRAIRAISRISTDDEKNKLLTPCLYDTEGAVRMRAEEELKHIFPD